MLSSIKEWFRRDSDEDDQKRQRTVDSQSDANPKAQFVCPSCNAPTNHFVADDILSCHNCGAKHPDKYHVKINYFVCPQCNAEIRDFEWGGVPRDERYAHCSRCEYEWRNSFQ